MKKIFLLLLLTSMLLTSGCTDSDISEHSPEVQIGDIVSVNYTGMLDNGTVFDTSRIEVAQANGLYTPSRNYEPISFVAGGGQMIQGFDEAVIGMKAGDEKTVTIPPEKAYGEVMDEAIVDIPVEDFEAVNMTPVVGEQITSQGFQGTIVNVSNTNVTVDFNHRLAGKNLTFEIELVSIDDSEDADQV